MSTRAKASLITAVLTVLSLPAGGAGATAAAAAEAAQTLHGSRCPTARTSKRRARIALRDCTPGRRTHPAVRTPSPGAIIAAALVAPCPDAEAMPVAGNEAAAAAAVLCLINRERASHGELPLRASSKLERAATGHCQELVADDYFAHISPSGVTPTERIRATGYIPASAGYVIGENLAWGTLNLATPASIVAAWEASPGHLANILESQYRDSGVGVCPAVPSSFAEGQPGGTYAEEFGTIIA